MNYPKQLRAARVIEGVIPYLLAAGLVLLIYKLHMTSNVDSMLNEHNTDISNGFLTSQVTYHQELPAFARRPLTSWIIENTASGFDLRIGESFILVNFSLLFLSGIFLYYLSRHLTGSPRLSLLNMLIYFFTFSLLFAFFPPIFTYDEPLQYCLVFLAIHAYFRKQYAVFLIVFTMSLIAKESSLFLLPALAVFFTGERLGSSAFFSTGRWRQYLTIIIPVILYGCYLLFFLSRERLWGAAGVEMNDRLSSIEQNFGTQPHAVETLVSLFLSLGPFLVFLIAPAGSSPKSAFEKKWVKAFWLTFLLNSAVVITATLARESRLFAVPLFFIWPVFGLLFRDELKLLFSVDRALHCFRKLNYLTALLFMAFINYLLAFRLYRPTFGSPRDNYFNEYFFLMLMALTIYLIMRHFARHRVQSALPEV